MWKMKIFRYGTGKGEDKVIEAQVLKFLNDKNLPPERVKIIGHPPHRGIENLSSAVVFYYERRPAEIQKT